MEESTWEQRHHALTHILTHLKTTPSVYSQIFIAGQILGYRGWKYYHPIFGKLQFEWGFGLFLRKASGLKGSWRSKFPYQQPPSVLAKGVEATKWGDKENREYVRKKLGWKKVGYDINPWIPILVPNLIIFSFMFWDPFLFEDHV